MDGVSIQGLPAWAAPAAAGVLLVLGVLLGLAVARWRVTARIARSRRVGREGGKKAVALLRRRGFTILETEVTAEGRMIVDGEAAPYRVRADAIVKKWFRRYVAEFKGGTVSASPANRATRRQLLEYALLFDVHGVLLVDAAAGKIRRVEFPRRR